ncbi:MAG: hypothetical protein E7Z89_00160 [Cyanobacteria bacterium SIG28]|nr:hypothetical protein [Cyanobacteria bacterium SIG28]
MSTNDISLGTGLGTLGLNSPGMYSSYAGIAPYSLSFGGLGSLGAMGAMGTLGTLGTMGTMGYNPMLMGMYNPVYYSQLMNQMETNQAHHSADMQALTLQNELRAYQNTDNATINKIVTNASVQQNITNLYNAVQSKNLDGICDAFDNLKMQILSTYGANIAARGDKENADKAATRIIETLYRSMTNSDLRTDIAKCGEKAATNGFMQGFRPGHHDRYVDETLHHCFGSSIDRKQSKDEQQELGRYVGKAARVVEKSAIGAGIGAAGYTALWGLSNLIPFISPKFNFKAMARFGKIGGLAAAGISIYNLFAKDKVNLGPITT